MMMRMIQRDCRLGFLFVSGCPHARIAHDGRKSCCCSGSGGSGTASWCIFRLACCGCGACSRVAVRLVVAACLRPVAAPCPCVIHLPAVQPQRPTPRPRATAAQSTGRQRILARDGQKAEAARRPLRKICDDGSATRTPAAAAAAGGGCGDGRSVVVRFVVRFVLLLPARVVVASLVCVVVFRSRRSLPVGRVRVAAARRAPP